MRGSMAAGAALTLLVTGVVAGCGTGDGTAARTVTVTPTPTTTAATPTTATATATSGASADAKPSATVVTTLATGLDVPWGLTLLPDGTVLVATRDDGLIRRLDPATGRLTDFGKVAASVSNVDQGGEAGLLGLAASPSYATDGKLFAYYSTASDNRIAWSTDGSTWHVIVKGIPHGVHHNGGRLAFGPDGMLYAGTGESGDTSLSQDKDSLGGKILRMTPDGQPADGNPFDSLVWSYGHRNVQGLAFDADGRLWASEFGDKTADELNLIQAGANYGWPATQGRTDNPDYTSPARQWGTDEDSPSGIAIAGGAVWMAALKGERLWRIPLSGAKAGTPKAFLTGTYGRLRSVLALDDDTLLVTTSNRDGRTTPGAKDDRILLVSVS
ncbi:MAG: PQQ-dependent sugar dehydrogenase [Nocardioides sp.]|uniref:PQQ-dependent sugar dehydrogenase n=1 Tax=Nocardioides sp. TaxID=35761 RepID=UPI0039E2B710